MVLTLQVANRRDGIFVPFEFLPGAKVYNLPFNFVYAPHAQ
jgi:hypothetical protein